MVNSKSPPKLLYQILLEAPSLLNTGKNPHLEGDRMADSGFTGNLLDSVSESLVEQEKLCDKIRRSLELSEDPGKLVLDAVGDLYSDSACNVRKRGCVALLEQLAMLRPGIAPLVKAEAASLARRWRVEIGEKGRNGVLEVMGFLLLLGAYDLLDEFDGGEISSVLRSFANRRRQAGAEESEKATASGGVISQKTCSGRSLKEELELVNQIASSFTDHFDAIKCFCIDMDGRNLKLFLCEYLGAHDWSTELRDALKQTPDPAKLVFDAMPGFLTPQSEPKKILSKAKVRKSCIVLLEQLMAISPRISRSMREEALKFANEREFNSGQMYQSPVNTYGFLLFIAVYGIHSKYTVDELLRLLEISSEYKISPTLCRVLGLAGKVEDLVRTLVGKAMFLNAVNYVCAYDLRGKFPPVRLLKEHLNLSKQQINEKGDKLSLQQAADKEISVLRNVIKYISKYRLESEYSPEELEKQISELEKKKKLKFQQTANVPVIPVSRASAKADVEQSPNKDSKLDNQAQVSVELSQKKDPKLDEQSEETCEPSRNEGPKLDYQSEETREPSRNEGRKIENQFQAKVEPSPKEEIKLEKACNEDSTSLRSRWPRLESLCASIYENGLSFFSRKQTEVEHSLIEQLKSLCLKMDGRSVIMFLYDHINNPYLDRYAVYDALKYVSNPAELVLDAMPGFLHSHPEFDESLSLEKVRKSRILLLEALIIVPPRDTIVVKEKAMKMASEWDINLGINYKDPSVVFGFLLFIAAYDLVTNYDQDELLSLLLPANYHKPTCCLVRILGLENKIFGGKRIQYCNRNHR